MKIDYSNDKKIDELFQLCVEHQFDAKECFKLDVISNIRLVDHESIKIIKTYLCKDELEKFIGDAISEYKFYDGDGDRLFYDGLCLHILVIQVLKKYTNTNDTNLFISICISEYLKLNLEITERKNDRVICTITSDCLRYFSNIELQISDNIHNRDTCLFCCLALNICNTYNYKFIPDLFLNNIVVKIRRERKLAIDDNMIIELKKRIERESGGGGDMIIELKQKYFKKQQQQQSEKSIVIIKPSVLNDIIPTLVNNSVKKLSNECETYKFILYEIIDALEENIYWDKDALGEYLDIKKEDVDQNVEIIDLFDKKLIIINDNNIKPLKIAGGSFVSFSEIVSDVFDKYVIDKINIGGEQYITYPTVLNSYNDNNEDAKDKYNTEINKYITNINKLENQTTENYTNYINNVNEALKTYINTGEQYITYFKADLKPYIDKKNAKDEYNTDINKLGNPTTENYTKYNNALGTYIDKILKLQKNMDDQLNLRTVPHAKGTASLHGVAQRYVEHPLPNDGDAASAAGGGKP